MKTALITGASRGIGNAIALDFLDKGFSVIGTATSEHGVAELNKKGKAAKFFAGTTAGGIAEGVFIGDVENAGTLGDSFGGFTELERAEARSTSFEIIEDRVK